MKRWCDRFAYARCWCDRFGYGYEMAWLRLPLVVMVVMVLLLLVVAQGLNLVVIAPPSIELKS